MEEAVEQWSLPLYHAKRETEAQRWVWESCAKIAAQQRGRSPASPLPLPWLLLLILVLLWDKHRERDSLLMTAYFIESIHHLVI